MRHSLSGQAVFITGPARGIGAEVARRLAARGARLSLVGLEPELLARLAAELGDRHVWFECDVTDQASLERAVAGTIDALGGIDVVIANAGIASNGTVAVGPLDALLRVIEVNLVGVVRTVSATLPHVTIRSGHYQLVSSAAALAVVPGLSTYGASKAGVEQFGNALRLELAPSGVTVSVVHPGWIDTDLVRDQKQDLTSFNEMLRTLPWPFNIVTPVGECAEAMVDAIERRRRRVFIPRALAPFAVMRQLLTSALADRVVKRQVRRLVPLAEREVRALGRPFGSTSMGHGRPRGDQR